MEGTDKLLRIIVFYNNSTFKRQYKNVFAILNLIVIV